MVLRRVKDLVRNKFNVVDRRGRRERRLAAGGAGPGAGRQRPAVRRVARSTRCCAFIREQAEVSNEEKELQTFSDGRWPRPRLQALGGLSGDASGWNGSRARCAAMLGEVLARDEIKDPRVRGAGLITVTHVRVSGDLRHARGAVHRHGPTRRRWSACAQGLNHASGYFRQAIARRLRMKVVAGRDVRGRPGVRAGRARREAAARGSRRARDVAPSEPRRRRDDGRRRRRRRRRRARTTRPARQRRRPGRRQADRADLVRRRAQGAARGRPASASATAARWTRLASGVLPICLGEATKLAQFLLDADKEYDVHGLLRRRDRHRRRRRATVTARPMRRASTRRPSSARWRPSRARSRRCRPVYSALKRDGRPLYDYARAGETVEVAPRDVVVHELELTSLRGPDAVVLRDALLEGDVRARRWRATSGGRWASGAHVTALRRTRSGPFALAEARPLDERAGGSGGRAADRRRFRWSRPPRRPAPPASSALSTTTPPATLRLGRSIALEARRPDWRPGSARLPARRPREAGGGRRAQRAGTCGRPDALEFLRV